MAAKALTVFRLRCSYGSKFVADNSDYMKRFFYNWPRCLRQHKSNQSRLNRDGTFVVVVVVVDFWPGADAYHVYVGDWALCCLHGLISTQTPSAGLRHPSFNHCRINSYVMGSWNWLSANARAVFRWCWNSSEFVTNNSNKTRHVICSRQRSLHQHK